MQQQTNRRGFRKGRPHCKQLLQGIWVNDETEMPLMRIEGDTVYYANPQSAPVPFKVVHDTIYIYSNEPVAYKIDRQTEYSFWFHSLADEVIKLHKSENAEDSLVSPVEKWRSFLLLRK